MQPVTNQRLSDDIFGHIGSFMHDDAFINLLIASKRIYTKESILVATLKGRNSLVNRLFQDTVASLPALLQNPQVLASITWLDLSGFDFLEVSLAEIVASFSGLQKLDMAKVCGLYNKDFLSLKPLPHLREFIYEAEDELKDELDDKALEHLVEVFPNLETLVLVNCSSISAKGYECISALQELYDLDLSSSALDNTALKAIATQCTNIHKLALVECSGVTPEGYQSLLHLQELRELVLSESVDHEHTVNDDVLQIVVQLPHLEKLLLSYCDEITSNGFKLIASLKKLQELDLEGSRVDDTALQAIGTLTQLNKLSLQHCQNITPKGFRCLASLNLSILNVSDTHIDDGTLQFLMTKYTNLQHLIVRNCGNLTHQCLQSLNREGVSIQTSESFKDC